VHSRRLVYISGAPGSGKTSLAVPLAAELGFALLAKDRVKETLHASLGGGAEVDQEWSRRLGAASMELLWALAADAPAVILEANFWSDDQRVKDRLAELAAQPVEVFCACPAAELARRYSERAPARSAVHRDESQLRALGEIIARSDHPVGVGAVITADTTKPVDVALVAAQVRTLLP